MCTNLGDTHQRLLGEKGTQDRRNSRGSASESKGTDQIILKGNLSKTATCGPILTELYREVAALQR